MRLHHDRYVAHLHPRGKGLGGSSGINFLCWIKPPAADIDGKPCLTVVFCVSD